MMLKSVIFLRKTTISMTLKLFFFQFKDQVFHVKMLLSLLKQRLSDFN